MNDSFDVKMSAVMRAAGIKDGDARAALILKENATDIFIRCFEAIFRCSVSGKYMQPKNDAEVSWNSEVLINQLRDTTHHASLDKLSGYQIANGDEKAIELVVDVLYNEGIRLVRKWASDRSKTTMVPEDILQADSKHNKNTGPAQRHRTLTKALDKRGGAISSYLEAPIAPPPDDKKRDPFSRSSKDMNIRPSSANSNHNRQYSSHDRFADTLTSKKLNMTSGKLEPITPSHKLLRSLFDQMEDLEERIKRRRKIRKIHKTADKASARKISNARVPGRPMVIDAPPVLEAKTSGTSSRMNTLDSAVDYADGQYGFVRDGDNLVPVYAASATSGTNITNLSDEIINCEAEGTDRKEEEPGGDGGIGEKKEKRNETAIRRRKKGGKSRKHVNVPMYIAPDPRDSSEIRSSLEYESRQAYIRKKQFMDRSESKRALLIKLSEDKLAKAQKNKDELEKLNKELEVVTIDSNYENKGEDSKTRPTSAEVKYSESDRAKQNRLLGPSFGPPRPMSAPTTRDGRGKDNNDDDGVDGKESKGNRKGQKMSGRRRSPSSKSKTAIYDHITGRRRKLTSTELEAERKLVERRKHIRSVIRGEQLELKKSDRGFLDGNTGASDGGAITGPAALFDFVLLHIDELNQDELQTLVETATDAEGLLRPHYLDPSALARWRGQAVPRGRHQDQSGRVASYPGERTEESTARWISKQNVVRVHEGLTKGSTPSIRDLRQLSHLGQNDVTMISETPNGHKLLKEIGKTSKIEPLPLILYQSLEHHELLISVEYCHHCDWHNFSLRHDPKQYVKYADKILSFLSYLCHREGVLAKVTIGRFCASIPMKDLRKSDDERKRNQKDLEDTRIGAFEVQVAYSGSPIKKRLLFSKLHTRRWPNRKELESAFMVYLDDVGVLSLNDLRDVAGTIDIDSVMSDMTDPGINVESLCDPVGLWKECALSNPLWCCYPVTTPDEVLYPDLRMRNKVLAGHIVTREDVGPECPKECVFDLRPAIDIFLEKDLPPKMRKKIVFAQKGMSHRDHDNTTSVSHDDRHHGKPTLTIPLHSPRLSVDETTYKGDTNLLDYDIDKFMTEETHTSTGVIMPGQEEDMNMMDAALVATFTRSDENAEELESNNKAAIDVGQFVGMSRTNKDHTEEPSLSILSKSNNNNNNTSLEKSPSNLLNESSNYSQDDYEDDYDRDDLHVVHQGKLGSKELTFGDNSNDVSPEHLLEVKSSTPSGREDRAGESELYDGECILGTSKATDDETDAIIAALAGDSDSNTSRSPRPNTGVSGVSVPALDLKNSNLDGTNSKTELEVKNQAETLNSDSVRIYGADIPDPDYSIPSIQDMERRVHILEITTSGDVLTRPEFDKCKLEISLTGLSSVNTNNKSNVMKNGKVVYTTEPTSDKEKGCDTLSFYLSVLPVMVSHTAMTEGNLLVSVLSSDGSVVVSGNCPLHQVCKLGGEGAKADHFGVPIIATGKLSEVPYRVASPRTPRAMSKSPRKPFPPGSARLKLVVVGMASESDESRVRRMSQMNVNTLAHMSFEPLEGLDESEDTNPNPTEKETEMGLSASANSMSSMFKRYENEDFDEDS
jgi:hypothetical protein